jgi:hypothetical protein
MGMIFQIRMLRNYCVRSSFEQPLNDISCHRLNGVEAKINPFSSATALVRSQIACFRIVLNNS